MRRVVIVVFPNVQTLDVTAPAEVFPAASLIHPPGLRGDGPRLGGGADCTLDRVVRAARVERVRIALEQRTEEG